MSQGTWVGLDVHAGKTVAGVLDAVTGEVRSVRAPTLAAETVEWLGAFPAPVRVAYEAGPTGYGLARAWVAAGIACTVAAPSKIPRASGDKVKTDRRDAERLARLLRLGELVAVRVPEPHEEAARDLVRAREDARGELMRARHRLSKLLLRHGLVCDASAWTLAHNAWLRRQRFDSRPLQLTLQESYAAAVHAKTRRDALDQAIAELAAEPPFADIVGTLCCLRGVSTLTALGLTVELGDWHRFRPESLGPFLGLTPSEDSTGEQRRLGAITKTGNTHARRLLSKQPGTSGGACVHAPCSSGVDAANPPPCAPEPTTARTASTRAGTRPSGEANAALSSPSRSPASWPDTAGRSPPCKPRSHGSARRAHRRNRHARSDPRLRYEPPQGRRSTLDSGSTPQPAHQVMRSRPTPYQPRHNASTTAGALPPPQYKPAQPGLQAVPT